MVRKIDADRWGPRKALADGALLVGDPPLMPLSYGILLVAGSLLGFGALVSLGTSHRSVVIGEVVPAIHESHSPEAPAHHPAAPPAAPPAHGEAAHHEAPAHHETSAHHEGSPHHEAAHHEPDPVEVGRAEARETFTDKFLSRFLSTNCEKNRHSETGVQFAANSYSEFTDSKRTRYVEGEYRFLPGGFRLIAAEDNQLEFKMTGDTLAMTAVMVGGMMVPAPADQTLKVCRSDIHEPSPQAPKPVNFSASDGLRLAVAANDMEAVAYYLTLGGYIPTGEFAGVIKAANLEGPISTPIREASRQNEDNALKLKATIDALEAKRKAAELRRKAEEAKHPKAKAGDKDKGKEKPKEGGGHGGH